MTLLTCADPAHPLAAQTPVRVGGASTFVYADTLPPWLAWSERSDPGHRMFDVERWFSCLVDWMAPSGDPEGEARLVSALVKLAESGALDPHAAREMFEVGFSLKGLAAVLRPAVESHV